MRRRLVAALVALGIFAPAGSALGSCADASWDVPSLVALLAAAVPADVTATPDRSGGEALTVMLDDQARVAFALPPERTPHGANPRAGLVGFAAGPPGRYAVALSDAAWIDVVQDGAHIASGDFLGLHDCPGLRKVVAFDIGPQPFTVQISDAEVATIAVAVVPRR